jgi:hypothetical protein
VQYALKAISYVGSLLYIALDSLVFEVAIFLSGVHISFIFAIAAVQGFTLKKIEVC